MEISEARNQDRISELPPDIVYHILSYLPMVDAVRTTVWSKQWNRVWTKCLYLDFDSRTEFKKYKDVAQFVKFVSSVLYRRDSLDIERFRLHFFCPNCLPCIDHWICTAVWRNVVELDMRFLFDDWDAEFCYPDCIFLCKSLQVLKLNLRYGQVTCAPPASECFPSLKSFHLSIIEPEHKVMEKLFSCCPVLECLAIDGSVEGDLFGNHGFTISAPELKTVSLSLNNTQKCLDVCIDATKLVNLDVQRLGLTNYHLIGSVKSIVSANVGFSDLKVGGTLDLSNLAMGLLNQVSDVKSLSLSLHHFEDLHLPQKWQLPDFRNLVHLRLTFGDPSCWKLVTVFLNSACGLEELLLDNVNAKIFLSFSGIHRAMCHCLSLQLKTLSLKGFKGYPWEFEILKYLLKNGQPLKKIRISTSVHQEQQGLYQIQKFPRPTTCSIEFMQMQ